LNSKETKQQVARAVRTLADGDLIARKQLLSEELDKKRRKHISLTDKGFKYLEKYAVILDFIDEFEL